LAKGEAGGERVRARLACEEAAFWQVRDLLVETYAHTPLGFNWDVRRWDGALFYDAQPDWQGSFAGRVRLWETVAGQLVAVVHPGRGGSAHLEVRTGYRFLEEEMISWAESECAAAPTPDGRRQLSLFVHDDDETRQAILACRGYESTDGMGVIRRMSLAAAALPPQPPLPQGYIWRTMQPEQDADCQAIADLLNAAFRRDFHNAAEYRTFTRLAPSYRQELDLVAVAPDGTFAAYVGIPYDAPNRRGIFEPVCTHPAHRRRGLAQSLMVIGLHRLQAMGARDVTVETGDMLPANRLYDSLGFTEVATWRVWRRLL
jgi:ribosomal protein S18 acetylase RimI-like enzyme